MFIVEIRPEGGRVRAFLSGWRDEGERDEPPGPFLYLAEDEDVRSAAAASEYAVKRSGCRGGELGRPCGGRRCAACSAAREDAFTHAILACVKLPGGEFAERLAGAVSSATGMPRARVPWRLKMGSEEAGLLIGEFGNCQKGGKE